MCVCVTVCVCVCVLCMVHSTIFSVYCSHFCRRFHADQNPSNTSKQQLHVQCVQLNCTYVHMYKPPHCCYTVKTRTHGFPGVCETRGCYKAIYPPTLSLSLPQEHSVYGEQPVSYWTQNQGAVTGVSQVLKPAAPFAKNTAFSTPIEEYRDQPKPHGIS